MYIYIYISSSSNIILYCSDRLNDFHFQSGHIYDKITEHFLKIKQNICIIIIINVINVYDIMFGPIR